MNIILNKKIIFIFLSAFFFVIPNVEAATIVKPANNLGLVGYWSFNEGTSTVATDFSGRGNTGTLNSFSAPASGSSGWGNGKFGSGLNFDGTGDYVSINGVADDVVETSFTFSVWIKSTWTAGFDTVLAINTVALGNQTQLFIDNTLGIRVYDGTQDATELSSSGSVVDGKWHHVVYSRSGATGTLYVDGVSQGTHNSSDTFTGTDLWSLGQEFDAGPVASDLYSGGMDDVRIYSRPLSGTEVLNLYRSGLITVGSANAQKNIVTSGLIGYWTLDGGEMTASTAYDRSTSANTLSLLSGPVKTVGKVGQSINMDAVDDQLFCTEANCGGTTGGKYDMGTRDWTAMAWIKPEAGATNCNARGSVVSKIGDDENGWHLSIGGQYICAEIRGAVIVTSSLDGSQVPLNEWSHIAVVFDRDGNMTRYLNGVQTGTQDNISANNGSSVDHPHNFCIGARDGGTGCDERLYDGSIDEVRVYERVVTANEIKQVYNAGVGTKVNYSQNVIGGSTLQSGLVGLWSFNGLDLTDRVYDRSGNSNDGYLVNMATSTAKVAGKVGQALNFDGTNDYVNAFSGATLDDLPALTYSAWIKPRSAGNGRATIVAKSDTASVIGLTYIYFDNVTATNGISFLRDTIATDIGYTTVNNVAPLNEWTHVVVSWDGTVNSTNNVRIYINGVESAYQISDMGLGGLESDAANNFTIGARSISGSERYFDGAIDEVRVYNRVLTASEAKQLYLVGR